MQMLNIKHCLNLSIVLKMKSTASLPQIIVLYNEKKLIMHPVILRLIKLKWDQFGKWQVCLYLLINLFYTFIWTAIGVSLPRKTPFTFYTPLKQNAWRIVLDIIGCAMTLVFVVKVS